MKKKILTIACLLLLVNLTNAQGTSTNDAAFGIKGGLNFTNLYVDDVDDNNVLNSFNVGIFGTFPLTESVSIQSELNYSRKGAELTYNNAFATGTAKFKLNYLEVPVLLKLNVTKNLNFHFGPYLAYLINGQVTNESNGGTFDFEDNFDNDDFNKFDYGLSGGIGLDFNTLILGIRYNYGLQTVGKERNFGGSTYTAPDGKNSALSIYLGIKL